MNNVALLGNTTRIETPYIKVQIGDYTFGIYQKSKGVIQDKNGYYEITKNVFPNYIKSLNITKINGEVNTYTLVMNYAITAEDDPNFFEKVFSSVSETRKIVFSYGDMSAPTYVYKNEEAIITDVKTNFNIQNSVISYTVSAVSSAALLKSGCYTFVNSTPVKPSDEIKKLLYNKQYGLQEIFYGMNNKSLVESKGLIAGDDKIVTIASKTNISALDYLTYLVSCMIPSSSTSKSLQQNDIYIMTIVDDTTGEFGGPYFKITKATKDISQSSAYELDIGYPTANIVTAFSVDNNENYSIYYNWQKKLNDKNYVYRIAASGKEEEIYAPIVSSKNDLYKTQVSDQTWWTKITSYPINASVTFKGLLRPAVLMTYVRLKIYFFGWKHIDSGLYIVTKQQDTVDESGYRTVLNLTRVSGDEGSEDKA
jgi:hypothetical protein